MTKTEYLLATLAEEAAEVAQACCKALRFGLNDPTREVPAEIRIIEELADLEAVVDLLKEAGVQLGIRYEVYAKAKQRKLDKMAHSIERGILES